MNRRLLAALLAALLALQLLALLRAPAQWRPAAIAIHLAQPGSVTLSAAQLAAVQAGATDVTVRRAMDGSWRLRAAGSARPLLRRAGTEDRLGTVDTAALQDFRIGTHAFTGTASAPFAFTDGALRWHYDGATVYRDGAAQPACPHAPWSGRAVALWNRAAPQPLTIARPLVFGGNLHCGNRIGLAGVEAGSAQVARAGARLLLSATTATVSAGGSSLRDDERSLQGVQSLTLGRTRYSVAMGRDLLTLTPSRRIALHAVQEMPLPPGVTWQWQQRSLWQGSGVAWIVTLGAAGAALLSVTLADRPGRRRRGNILAGVSHLDEARARRRPAPGQRLQGPGAALLLAAGVVSLVQQRGGDSVAVACSLLLAGSALGAWLAPRRPVHPALAAALLLMGVGLLCQLDLGLAGLDTGWLRYYHKTAALLAAGSGAAALWRAYPARASQARIEWLLAIAAGGALLALAAQVLWGDETGVFDLQPVEFAKLVLLLLTAHCLALRMGWRAEHRTQPGIGARWLRLTAPVLLFLALLGCALVQVDDYSPLILLLAWAGAMTLAFALAARRWLAAGMLAGVALAGIAGVTALRDAAPESLPASFYGDRFQVWREPARHPHTGQQVQQGAAAIAAGGWFGADGMFGLASLGQPGGTVMLLPAVQDDFAPAFLLHRHGLLAALLLWGAQAALVAGLVQAGVASARAGSRAPGFRRAWLLRLRAFTLCGGAAFIGGHLLLSWGTNLAMLPVMGQPMSFLSAGGSHLLFFLLPLLGICAGSHDAAQPHPQQE